MPQPETIRDTLLQSARDAGERYIQVRGTDLEQALQQSTSSSTTRLAKSPEQKDS